MGKLSDQLAEHEYKQGGGAKGAAANPMPTPMPMGEMDEETGSTVIVDDKRPQFSTNRFERRRYIEVTDQIRRLPIGLVLITDQTFIKDILESLLQIKLRLQTTQVTWVRFHDSLNYGDSATDTAPIGPKKRDAFALPTPIGSTPSNSREDQFSANLMELTVYGFLTFYEHPPEEKAPKTTGKK